MARQFSNVSSRFGSPMGRASYGEPTTKMQLFRVRFVEGDYDDGGAYWGGGKPLYCLRGDDCERFTRAEGREQAEDIFKRQFPTVALIVPIAGPR